jgi:hypothetical protein
MPNCYSYSRLSIEEQIEFTLKLNHAMQNDEFSFQMASSIVNRGEAAGLFSDLNVDHTIAERMEKIYSSTKPQLIRNEPASY